MVVVIGGSSDIGLGTARQAHVERFFEELTEPIDHVMVTGGGPYY